MDLGEEFPGKGKTVQGPQCNRVPGSGNEKREVSGAGVRRQKGRVVGSEMRSTGEVMGSVSCGTWVFTLSRIRNYWRVSSTKGHDLTQILRQLPWLQSWKQAPEEQRWEQRVCNQCQ